MLRWWMAVMTVLLIVVIFAGITIVYFTRARTQADLLRCQNNLRELSQFAHRYADPLPEAPRLTIEVPAGTIVNASLPPDERLSWYVTALPWLDQKRMPVVEALGKIDRSQSWSAGSNEDAAKLKLTVLLCPGLPPEIDPARPAPTNYFGSAGIGADAATLAIRKVDLRLGGFGNWSLPLVPPRAGCFRYDAPTPFDLITDGLSQTILLGEREPEYGAWMRGGPTTVRGIDPSPNAPPVIGTDAQFGGGHPVGANFAFADGSVRVITPSVAPRILEALMTISSEDHGALAEVE